MKKLIMLVLLVVASVGRVSAQALQVRTDSHNGRKPGLSIGLMTPEIELWAFNVPQFPIYEVGRTNYWPLGKRTSVLAGGYLSLWPKSNQWFVEPWSLWQHRAGKVNLSAKLAAYAPLNEGPWYLYSDQMAATYRVTPTLDLGVAADWWLVSGTKPAAGIGAVANLNLGDHGRLSLRALKGFNEADSLRFELTLF